MTLINERKLNDLERSVFSLSVITKLARFVVDEQHANEINLRWSYIYSMYNSLEKYLDLYNSTGSAEYKNLLENNYDSATQSIEEHKTELYKMFSLSSLLFLENIKKHFRQGFVNELTLITNQFNKSSDMIEYICYHGSLDLNNFIDYVVKFNINQNHKNLFEQIKNNRVITYKKEEWINISARLNSCLLEIKTKEQLNDIDNIINKLNVYRFLLIAFDYDF